MRIIPLLLFAANTCAFRKALDHVDGEQGPETTASELVDDLQPGPESELVDDVQAATGVEGCGSCDAMTAFLRGEAWSLSSPIGASHTSVGHQSGVCCNIRSRWWLVNRATVLFSASKMVSAYMIMRLIDLGFLSLETKAADVLDYWNATDGRSLVNVRHLLSLTSGLTKFPGGLAACTEAGTSGNGTRNCAKEAYNCFQKDFTVPGETFDYTETTFYVVSAMALEVTNSQYWDDVFQKYIGEPLGIDSNSCQFTFPDKSMAFAGGGLRCTNPEFSKILQSILGKTLLDDKSLYDVMERPHTLNVRRSVEYQQGSTHCTETTELQGCTEEFMPEWDFGWESTGVYWHYGLGQWVECADPACEGGVLRTSSLGAMGTYPWVDRGVTTGNKPHWGLAVRFTRSDGPGLTRILDEVVPRAADIVN